MEIEELLRLPIVGAPMAGGPTTPELAASVSAAGGLGFLAAGYQTADAVEHEFARTRELTGEPFGVNLFFPFRDDAQDEAIERYIESLREEEDRYGVATGEPLWRDDEWESKLGLIARERPSVVSFTFGCPEREIVHCLQELGILVWTTVTSPAEAQLALAADVDALVLQGAEAGGHQGAFTQHDDDPLPLLVLVQLVAPMTNRPLIAAGGIATAEAIRAVRVAGARLAQIGSALMLTPEAGTSEPHRAAFRQAGPTRLTRAFSGKRARGIVNRFMQEHDPDAPIGYPQIHYVTAPLRAAARERGDAGGINLWAGQGYSLAIEAEAGELVERWAEEAGNA
jgi:nitronate monooxygenase